ncbi:MAG: alpha/beta hydrolase [bacterium]|nr:alpha/beta hydrolase [bacterium]
MLKLLTLFILLMGLISCSTYKIAERHLNGKMKRAEMKLNFEEVENGAKIEYWDSADSTKPNLLLVHGFGASTKYQWYKQVKLLSRKYRVIAPNLNYFGRTVPDSANYSVEGQVETLEALLSHLNVDTCALMGVSYGGLVSAELASQTGRTITEMVLFDTPTKFADSSDINKVIDYFETPSIEELFVPSEPEGLNKLLFLATGKNRNIPAAFLEDFHKESYAYNLEDKRQLIGGLLADMEKYRKREYHFNMPILLIWGEEDKVVPISTGEQLADYFGENAKLKVIEGAAHMPNMTHKKEFNILIEVFLGITK